MQGEYGRTQNGFRSISIHTASPKPKKYGGYAKYIDKYLYELYNGIEIILWEESGMEIDEKRAAQIFKALCDENRIRIIKLLNTGEKCACKLLEELNITQPTLSHHMKILCDSGIVTGRKEGKWMHYSVSSEGSETAVEYLNELTKLKNAACREADLPCCDK